MTHEEEAAFYAQLAAALLAQGERTKIEILAAVRPGIVNPIENDGKTEKEAQFLKFTAKEISRMPKEIRKEFRAEGLRAHIRKRTRGNSTNYEIRCRRQGLNISASGLTVEEAKERFIAKLNEIQKGKEEEPEIIMPKDFTAFALDYFENYRKKKVTAATYASDYRRLKGHILPHFKDMQIKKISPRICQALIDRLTQEGKGKTAEEVFSIINGIFKYAIRYKVTDNNPMEIVFMERHERQHGKALTKEEEKRLLAETPEPYKTLLAIGLYTGLRPNEYATIRICDGMIHARNSKRKHGKEETKRIPITPMLRPYLVGVTAVEEKNPEQLRYWFNAVFGKTHKLYDLRTTFYTRCKECDIAPAARDEFMGHSAGALGNAYTDLSDEFLKKEGEKLNY